MEKTLVLNQIIPLKSIKKTTRNQLTYIQYHYFHYFALEISTKDTSEDEKQFIICIIDDETSSLQIIDREDAFGRISSGFIAYWADFESSTLEELLKRRLDFLKLKYEIVYEDKKGKPFAKFNKLISYNAHKYEAPVYNNHEIKELLEWIVTRSHSDDID